MFFIRNFNSSALKCKEIYISGLPFKATKVEVTQLFAKYGSVDNVRHLGRKDTFSLGYGFVEMKNDAEADKAIAGLNGQDMEGRYLKVEVASPKKA